MLRTVFALEPDGLDVRVLTLPFAVPDEGFDLRNAVRKAATDYCKTPEGRKVYEDNRGCFNWADFAANVPQKICESHGFKMFDPIAYGMGRLFSSIEVDRDEQLVDDSELDEEWQEYLRKNREEKHEDNEVVQ